MVRYEIKNRGSLHAHLILWVEDLDRARFAHEISTDIPKENNKDPYTMALHDLVITK